MSGSRTREWSDTLPLFGVWTRRPQISTLLCNSRLVTQPPVIANVIFICATVIVINTKTAAAILTAGALHNCTMLASLLASAHGSSAWGPAVSWCRHPGSGRRHDKNIFLFRLIPVFSPAAAVWARPWSNFPEFASNEGNDHDDVYLVI